MALINPSALVREALRTALSDPVTGFNAQWAAVVASSPASHNLPPAVIDWTDYSHNYQQHFMNPVEVNLSRFPRIPDKLGIIQYCSEVRTKEPAEMAKGSWFDGEVTGHVDVIVVRDEGVASVETKAEYLKDAVITAVLGCIHDRTLPHFQREVMYTTIMQALPQFTLSGEDGYAQYIPLQFLFSVQIS